MKYPERPRWIPKDEMVVGGLYLCHARNFSVGVWTGKGLLGPREKLGSEYLFEEYHWDDGQGGLGTMRPLYRLQAEDVFPIEESEQLLSWLWALSETSYRTRALEIEVGVLLETDVEWESKFVPRLKSSLTHRDYEERLSARGRLLHDAGVPWQEAWRRAEEEVLDDRPRCTCGHLISYHIFSTEKMSDASGAPWSPPKPNNACMTCECPEPQEPINDE